MILTFYWVAIEDPILTSVLPQRTTAKVLRNRSASDTQADPSDYPFTGNLSQHSRSWYALPHPRLRCCGRGPSKDSLRPRLYRKSRRIESATLFGLQIITKWPGNPTKLPWCSINPSMIMLCKTRALGIGFGVYSCMPTPQEWIQRIYSLQRTKSPTIDYDYGVPRRLGARWWDAILKHLVREISWKRPAGSTIPRKILWGVVDMQESAKALQKNDSSLVPQHFLPERFNAS